MLVAHLEFGDVFARLQPGQVQGRGRVEFAVVIAHRQLVGNEIALGEQFLARFIGQHEIHHEIDLQPAERGLADSQFNLAVLNENGLGVEQNMVAAYKWLSLAAKSGDKEAIRRRDILKGKLTAEQLAKADGLVATWRAKPQIPDVNDARKAGEAWKKNPENGING